MLKSLLRGLGVGLLTIGLAIGLTIVLWFGHIPIAQASIFSFAGDRPTNLGMHDGQFAPCAATPNCVSSQATDVDHQIAPIAYSGDATKVWADLQQVLTNLPNATIVAQTENYLDAEFTSQLMGFVDDVEFYLAADAIQVRSASRLGESDLGVNRQRIETIREQLRSAAASSQINL
jgi:uncharacterized protein (DUF1499 family)